MPVSSEHVRWAYRLFLDREPEDDTYIQTATSLDDHRAIREYFMSSAEFTVKNAALNI